VLPAALYCRFAVAIDVGIALSLTETDSNRLSKRGIFGLKTGYDSPHCTRFLQKFSISNNFFKKNRPS
jgi:hypothetical protein